MNHAEQAQLLRHLSAQVIAESAALLRENAGTSELQQLERSTRDLQRVLSGIRGGDADKKGSPHTLQEEIRSLELELAAQTAALHRLLSRAHRWQQALDHQRNIHAKILLASNSSGVHE
jgi:hypothetical protein